MMRRTAFSIAFVAAFAAVCLSGLAYFALNMGLHGPWSREFQLKAEFAAANGLVAQDDVRVSGVSVGKVTGLDRAGSGTVVTMALQPGVELRQDTRAVIRPKSLLGEQFVELIRPQGSDRPALQSGATIPRSQTGQSVQIDDILNAVADPQTRAAMSESFRELGVAVDGRAQDVSNTLPPLDSTMANFRPLARVGEARQKELDRILTNLNTIMQALADEQDALGRIVDSGNTVMGAMASRDAALASTVENGAAVFASLDAVFANLTPADRASLQLSPGAIAAGRHMLAFTNPEVDRLLPEILLSQISWPDNQINITTTESLTLASEWISAFSRRDIASDGNYTLGITSICPSVVSGPPAACPTPSTPQAGVSLPGQLPAGAANSVAGLPADLSQLLLKQLKGVTP
jgi:virulence factor Mce-like protein